jgi:RND family efflux transporter MFP subunit
MKYIILLLSLVYITTISSCKSKTTVDDHQHDETEQVQGTHIHTEDDATPHNHQHDEVEVTQDMHIHAEDDTTAHIHQHDEVDQAQGTHLHTEDDAAAHNHESDKPGTGQSSEALSVVDDHYHSGEDHSIIEVKKQNFRFTHKTSGLIMVDKKDEIIITASSPGIVRFFDHFLFPGVAVKSGQQMFGIYGESLTEGNTSINYANRLLEYENASANYERATKLIDDKLITSDQFLTAKMDFEKAKVQLDLYNKSRGVGGSSVSAPSNCYIQEIFVKEGQKVETGQQLASVIIEHNLILKADIAPSDLGMLNMVQGATFITGYSPKVYSTSEMNGTMISFGKSTGENSFYIPVYFRLDYTKELIPGTFAEVWLLGSEIEQVIAIPNGAIMEEYGKYYVFVEHVDGDFEKRFLTMGMTDGKLTHIINGLHENEKIVVEGAYQVKMSQMTSIPNTHDHNH